ncbi:MAG: anthranilate synthase component I [Candidatus Altiarchaeales archaeon]|nr:anthranilate synthase component I [Candidatus Altiarchaeales archaeon]
MQVNQTFIKIKNQNPEETYLKIAGENTYLLESIEGDEKKARYSFIGFNPLTKIKIKNGKTQIKNYTKKFTLKEEGREPLNLIKNIVTKHPQTGPTLSRFAGGFVGYLSYDLIRYFTHLPNKKDTLKQPDAEICLTKNNIIFDHLMREAYLVENHFTDSQDIDVEKSLRRLEEIAQTLTGQTTCDETRAEGFESNTTKKEYMNSVKQIKNHIREGDTFQTVLSQRLSTEYSGDKFAAYLKLKQINPSPYMYYLDFGDRKIVGSSPETLARVENQKIFTYPIAGTRKRGENKKQEALMERELTSDPKEKAEHTMLVDLGRNDVGRVSSYGSVSVTKYMELEKYSHVMHLSSEVEGRLKPGLDEYDALKSIFPAGTVSGAPKVRSMQIIDEVEPDRRGIYAGCIGYFSFNRTLDTAIAIRTITFEKNKAYVQAGAGVVADSKPELEYKETLNKGQALLKTLGVRS